MSCGYGFAQVVIETSERCLARAEVFCPLRRHLADLGLPTACVHAIVRQVWAC